MTGAPSGSGGLGTGHSKANAVPDFRDPVTFFWPLRPCNNKLGVLDSSRRPRTFVQYTQSTKYLPTSCMCQIFAFNPGKLTDVLPSTTPSLVRIVQGSDPIVQSLFFSRGRCLFSILHHSPLTSRSLPASTTLLKLPLLPGPGRLLRVRLSIRSIA